MKQLSAFSPPKSNVQYCDLGNDFNYADSIGWLEKSWSSINMNRIAIIIGHDILHINMHTDSIHILIIMPCLKQIVDGNLFPWL